MKFSLHTLIALSATVGCILTCLRSSVLGAAIMLFVLPISMMVFALTSPQRDGQLDVSQRWYLSLVAKTWVYSLVGLVLLKILFAFNPAMKYSLLQAIQGERRGSTYINELPERDGRRSALTNRLLQSPVNSSSASIRG